MNRYIQTFTGRYLAVFRRNKKTYSIITYDTNARRWHSTTDINTTTHPPALNSSPIESAKVKLYVSANLFIECVANGAYIDCMNYHIPIVTKVGSSRQFPASIFMNEFECTTQSSLPHPDNPLWILYPITVAIAVPPALARRVLQGIPKRIAWIIAEDASKKEETCPITMEVISPITASVTNCFHVFDTNAITTWLQTHTECPVCKQPTVSTVCYTEG